MTERERERERKRERESESLVTSIHTHSDTALKYGGTEKTFHHAQYGSSLKRLRLHYPDVTYATIAVARSFTILHKMLHFFLK